MKVLKTASAIIAMIVISSCAVASEDGVTLVRLKPDPTRIRATAAKEGVLDIHNGCVYFVSKSSKTRVLPIWEPSYDLWRVKGKVVGVIDTATGQKLKFGVNHTFGGGEVSGDLSGQLEKPIPESCDGIRGYTYF